MPHSQCSYPPLGSGVSRELSQLCTQLLQVDPGRRPTMTQILNSPVLRSKMHLLPDEVVNLSMNAYLTAQVVCLFNAMLAQVRAHSLKDTNTQTYKTHIHTQRARPDSSHGNILNTIRVPKGGNLAAIQCALPPANYDTEEERAKEEAASAAPARPASSSGNGAAHARPPSSSGVAAKQAQAAAARPSPAAAAAWGRQPGAAPGVRPGWCVVAGGLICADWSVCGPLSSLYTIQNVRTHTLSHCPACSDALQERLLKSTLKTHYSMHTRSEQAIPRTSSRC